LAFCGCAVTDRLDLLPCAVSKYDHNHKHSARCLPIVARGLPLVAGYRWRYGSAAGGWSLWLERIGGAGGRWFVLDMPTAGTARELVAIIHAYATGSGTAED
jgi:hypothetical protein